jgi:hypothetical protein
LLFLAAFLIFQFSENAGRDRKRLEDLKFLREALFRYYNENGSYPSSISDWNPESPDMGARVGRGANDYDNLSSLLSRILPKLPVDPLNPANSPVVSDKYIYRYVASPDGRNFALIYETEEEDDTSPMIMRGW